MFVFGNGPLLIAIVAWRNSLVSRASCWLLTAKSPPHRDVDRSASRLCSVYAQVFHSLDKTTSVYIHMLPSLLTFCARW